MRRISTFLFLLSLVAFPAFSQVTLAPPITTGILPNDSQHIILSPSYIDTTGLFMSSGFGVNTVVPDFTLFDTLGNPTTLSTTLNLGKPVLLFCVSLSCPSSRHSIPNAFDDLYAQFGSQISVLIVYVVEAHPLSPDVSPYAQSVWEIPLNTQDSAELHQETTYGERKQKAAEFAERFTLPVPILIDGPGNEYWSTFGPSPNGAYLITTTGFVFGKYGWLDQEETALRNDIPLLLVQSGISQTATTSSAHLFPNPSNGNSYLSVENESSYNFRIVDMEGRVVVSEENISTSVFDLEKFHLDAGVYSVIVEGKSGRTFSLRYVIN
jgi:hypothetical protein